MNFSQTNKIPKQNQQQQSPEDTFKFTKSILYVSCEPLFY